MHYFHRFFSDSCAGCKNFRIPGAFSLTILNPSGIHVCHLIYTRVGTLIVTTIYLQLIQNRYMFRSFTLFQCSHHKGLSPCDFDLIPKMKEPLRGIRFRTVPEILQAVDRSIRTINTTGAAKGILRLPQRWQRVVHNAGDYIEGQ